jgi:hypothetical protein
MDARVMFESQESRILSLRKQLEEIQEKQLLLTIDTYGEYIECGYWYYLKKFDENYLKIYLFYTLYK